MNSEIEALEYKIEQVIGMVRQLRAENEVLRNQVASAEAERMALHRKMSVARERLEGLLGKIPDETA